MSLQEMLFGQFTIHFGIVMTYLAINHFYKKRNRKTVFKTLLCYLIIVLIGTGITILIY